MEPLRILCARHIFSMTFSSIRDGAVVVEGGRISAMGPAKQIIPQFPDADVHDYGSALILPGLVNAHVHLELSDLRSVDFAGDDFVEWLGQVVGKTVSPDDPAERILRAVEIGVAQCVNFGVTTVGDISRFSHVSRAALAGAPIQAVSFGEVLAMAGRRDLLEERLAAALDDSFAGRRLRVGISPHAPYSIELDGYRQCVQAARLRGMPLTTHLAESPHEREFLAQQSGPFRELWDRIGGWDDRIPRFDGGPVRFADAVGLLDARALLAHVNYAGDAEIDLLASKPASVVYCPRTHAYFGHPPHRWREMLARGINVAVGTDSTASSPDLNLVEELRLLHRIAPEIPPGKLWHMATTRGARALGLDGRAGCIAPGVDADLVVFATNGDDPLCEILESDMKPGAVWMTGTQTSPSLNVCE